ncbi:trse protein [Enterococcus faecalis]|uniref:trse protein n=1 Tax=Enterococcus faecalis TaxID=1351 RepID=UPI001363BE1B|nr:trse protein [Enterococcus faecalis]NBJ47126.1 trse protein [Enterococcus faecalis]
MIVDTDELLDVQEELQLLDTTIKEKKKKKIQKVEKSVLAFMPERRIISEECIALEKGVTNFYRIEDSSAREGSLEQRQSALNDFLVFLKTIYTDIKFIFTSFPIDMSENIDYAKRRFKMGALSETVKKEQQYTLSVLENLDNTRLIDTVYLQVFADDEDQLKEVEREIRQAQSTDFRINTMTLTQKIKFLFRRYNPLSPLPIGIPYQRTDYTGRDEKVQKMVAKKGYDPLFVGTIQPMGGIKPNSPKDLQIAEGFIRVLNLVIYRPKNNPNFWGEQIFCMKNVLTTLDTHTIDTSNPLVEQNLNRSLGEYEDRVYSSKDRISRKKARKEYEKLDRTVENVLESVEVLKEIHVRYVLAEPTIEKLDECEQEVMRKLRKHQFQAASFLDEQERQFKATFVSFKEAAKLIKRKGKEIKGTALAGSYAFNYANHIDHDAPYSGYPLYGSGVVCLSTTHKDSLRKSYSSIILGSQGFGKTTAAKKQLKQAVEYNNIHYGFYVSDETKRLTETLGGEFYDGREVLLNPCQIYRSDVDVRTKKTKEEQSLKTNLVKMRLVFGLAENIDFQSPIMTTAKKIFNNGYNDYMERHGLDVNKITQYDPEQYPVYSDILVFAKNEYNKVTEEFEKKDIYEFISKLESFITDSGNIFNQKSTFDFYNKKLVTFNMENLVKSDVSTYNAQYYNLYTAAFSEAVRVGQREKYLFDRKQKKVDELIYSNITSDEFHNPIRTRNKVLLKELDRYNREGRKLLIGQTYIMHDIADAFPDYNNENGELGEISQIVINLFKLSTYRFLFKQDESSEKLLKKVFGKQLSSYDIADIIGFEERDILLNIKGAKNIKFRYGLSETEKRIFDGGL